MTTTQITRELSSLPRHSRGRRVLEQIALRETTKELQREVKHIETMFKRMEREIGRIVAFNCRETM